MRTSGVSRSLITLLLSVVGVILISALPLQVETSYYWVGSNLKENWLLLPGFYVLLLLGFGAFLAGMVGLLVSLMNSERLRPLSVCSLLIASSLMPEVCGIALNLHTVYAPSVVMYSVTWMWLFGVRSWFPSVVYPNIGFSPLFPTLYLGTYSFLFFIIGTLLIFLLWPKEDSVLKPRHVRLVAIVYLSVPFTMILASIPGIGLPGIGLTLIPIPLPVLPLVAWRLTQEEAGQVQLIIPRTKNQTEDTA